VSGDAYIDLADGKRIVLLRGDITRQDADAIVNAANTHLAPGAGVCGAIHTAAGSAPFAEATAHVAEHGALVPGEAIATGAGNLSGVRHIIHAVGPVWHGGSSGESGALSSAYRRSIEVADGLGDETIAFPSISTGIFGYPLELAARTALEAIAEALARTTAVREVRVVLFDEHSLVQWISAAKDRFGRQFADAEGGE